MRIVVRVVSLLGSLLFFVLAVIALSIGSVSDGAGGSGNSMLAGLVMLCPLLYSAICFWTSFARHRGRRVLVAGLVAHLSLTAFVIATFVAGDIGGIFLVGAIFCALVWVGMYFSLNKISAGT